MAQRKLISRMGGVSPHIRLTDYHNFLLFYELCFGAPRRCTSLRFVTYPRRWSILLRLSWRGAPGRCTSRGGASCSAAPLVAHRDGAPPCASQLTQGGGASCSAAPHTWRPAPPPRTRGAPRRCTSLRLTQGGGASSSAVRTWRTETVYLLATNPRRWSFQLRRPRSWRTGTVHLLALCDLPKE